jgi:O-antigen/teichoic acid export membrane protein
VSTRRLATAGVIGIAGAFAAAVIGWVRTKGLSVELGPRGLGLYGQLWAFVLYCGTLGSLGIGVGTTALVAAQRERGDPGGLKALAVTAAMIALFAGGVIAVAVISASWLIAPLLLGIHAPSLIIIAALSLPLVAVQLPLQHAIQAFEDAVGQSVVYTIYSVVFTVAAVVGAVLDGVRGAVIGLVLGNLVLASLYFARTQRLLGDASMVRPLFAGTRQYVKPLLQIGAASLVVAVAFGVADLAVRTALLHGHGERIAGYWFALLTISLQFIATLVGAMTYFTAPLAARAMHRDDSLRVQRLLDDSLRLTLVVVMPVIVLIMALRGTVASVLFSEAFAPMSRYVPAQLLGDAIRAFGWTLGVALIPLGLTSWWFYTGLGTSLVYGVVGSLFAVHWGLGGACAAWVVAWTVSSIGTAGVLVGRRLWRPSQQAGLALAVSSALVTVAWLWPGTVGTFGAVFGAMLLAATSLHSSERSAVYRALRVRLHGSRT